MQPPALLRVVALLLIALLPIQGMAMAFSRTIGEVAPAPEEVGQVQPQGHEMAEACHHMGHGDEAPAPPSAPQSAPQIEETQGAHPPHCAQGHACCAAHVPPTGHLLVTRDQTADPPRAESSPAVPAYCPERLPRPPRA